MSVDQRQLLIYTGELRVGRVDASLNRVRISRRSGRIASYVIKLCIDLIGYVLNGWHMGLPRSRISLRPAEPVRNHSQICVSSAQARQMAESFGERVTR